VSKPQSWSRGLRVLHWLTVLVLGYELAVALVLMRPGMATIYWMPTHISLGAGLLLLVLLRLVWRMFERRPRRAVGRIALASSRLLQALLYLLLLATVVTGWIAYRPVPFAPAVQVAGIFALPAFPALEWLPNWPYAYLHRLCTWLLVAVAGMHIGAAILHGVRRDGVLSGMTWRG
jgi:cytochrome b561